MKVILSIDPIRYPLTGIGRYTLELARHLLDNEDVDQLRFFAGVSFRDGLPTSESAGLPGLASRLRPLKTLIARNDVALRAHQLVSHWRRGQALRNDADAIFHGPNFYLPPFAGRSIVTIHDLSVIRFPQFHPSERVRHMNREIELSLRRADGLVTDSIAIQQEICTRYGWSIDRVHVAPLASTGQFEPLDAAQTSGVLHRLGLAHGGYGLYVGTIEPRKNVERLLLAYERLPQAVRQRFPLILVGHKGWRNDTIMAKIEAATQAGWARYIGFVHDRDLPALFAGARAFLFPSIYEGFGLPVLEAMASAVPVVTSDTSSLPEVAGGAALLCAPEDVEGLTQAFSTALLDEIWRDQAIPLGLIRAQKFSWTRCAEETVVAYKKVSAR